MIDRFNHYPTTQRERTALRRLAGLSPHDSRPVRVTYGTEPPTEYGWPYHFRWLGRWKTAPGSYQASTRRVEVGEVWLREWRAAGAPTGGAALEAVQQRVAARERRARRRLRRHLAGYTPPAPTATATTATAKLARLVRASGRCAVDPHTREAVRLDGQLATAARPAWAGGWAQSPRLRALQCCLRALQWSPAHGDYHYWHVRAAELLGAEQTLERYWGSLTRADRALVTAAELAAEAARREKVDGVLARWRAGLRLDRADRSVLSPCEWESLRRALPERRLARAARALGGMA